MSDNFVQKDISCLFISWLDKLFDNNDLDYYWRDKYLILKALILVGSEQLFKYCVCSHYEQVLKDDLGI